MTISRSAFRSTLPPAPLQRHARRDHRPQAVLLLLCLLWSLHSLRSELFPAVGANPLPLLESETASFALLAVAAGVFAVLRRAQWPRGRQLGAAAAVGLGMFWAPAVLVSLSDAWVSETSRVALFSLAPVFAVVLEPHLGGDRTKQVNNGLAGGLAAMAGTLCVFPLLPPGSIEAAAAMSAVVLAAASVAAANCAAVRLMSGWPAKSIAPIACIAGAAAAVALAAVSALAEPAGNHPAISRWNAILPEVARAALFDLPGLLLLFWLMRRMTATRMTARFVLAPLMALLIGMAMEQPPVGSRLWAGLLLMAAGSAWLLFAVPQADDPSSSPLRLNS